MRKVRKHIASIVALLTIFALSSFAPVKGQTIDVFILYGPDAVNYVEVCQGTSIGFAVETFGGTGTGLTYTWTGDTDPTYFIDLGDFISYKSTTPSGTYNLTVDVQDDGGFTGSANLTVVIKPSPMANIIAMGPTTFCDGGSVELQENSGQTDVTYQWQRNFSNISGATSFNYTASISGGYRIRVTGTNGCSKTSTSLSVTKNELPVATASNDGPVCYDGTVNLTSGPGGLVSYTWTTNAVTPFNSTEQNPSITNVTPNNSGTYTVTVKDINGCEDTEVTTVLVYNELNPGSIGTDHSICYNGDPDLLTSITNPSGGDEDWTYQWQSWSGAGPWQAIVGATGLTYDPPAGLTQTTRYRRRATSALCGTVTSDFVTVTVYNPLNGGTISSNQFICYSGDPSVFSNDVPASGGDEVFTYSWESKVGAGAWTAIVGATGLTYDAPAGLTQTTMYRRVAVNTCGTVYSNELTVTVYDAVNGGAIADNQFVCYNGDPVAFTDATSPSGGNGAWSYQWESKVGAGAWAPIGGAIAITFDIPAGITQTTSYRRVSTNACGSANSNELLVTVYPQMNGGTITGDQSLCYNSDPTIINSGVAPTGGNGTWTYSWEYQSNCAGGWIAIAGTNSLTYDPPANQTETRCYRRVATNDCGTVYSNTVTITIYADINGGVIAADETVCYGADPIAFTSGSAASGGNGAFTYFWQQNTGSGWTNITGATAITYDIPAGITQTTQYRRGATNLCGTGYSNILTVTVSNAINGGQISSPAAVCYNGDPAAFTDITSPSGGSGAWVYSWEYRVGAGAWNIIAGANALTYDIPASQTETRTYRRVATNDCGTGYSNEVTVTVYGDITAGTIGSNQNVCYSGDPAPFTSLTLPTGGNGTWIYSWEFKVGAGAWTVIPGATAITYDVPAGIIQDTDYRRVATTSCGIAQTAIVTITVYSAQDGGSITADDIVCNGADPIPFVSTTPATGGNGAYAYQWQQNTGSGWTNITGAIALTYDAPAGITQTTQYRRTATNLCGTVNSNSLTITVHPVVSGGTIAVDQSVCYSGDPLAFTETVAPSGGSGAFTYTWESKVGAGAWTPIAGAIAATYDVPAGLTQTTQYQRKATNSCGTGVSNTITVTVYADLNAGTIAADQNICSGGDPDAFTSTLAPSGGNGAFTYSWEFKVGVGAWTIIAGAISDTYDAPAGLTLTTDYRRGATNSCGTVYSNTVTITVTSPIAGNTITADQTICSGSTPAQLDGPIPTGGSGVYAYQWQSSTVSATGPFSNITGANGQNYTPGALTQTTYFVREVTSGVCTNQSNTVTVTVNPPIANNTISLAQTICYNTAPSLLTGSVPTGGSGAYTYQWESSIVGVAGPFTTVAGATDVNYQPGSLTQNTWFRRIVNSLPCTNNISNVIAITVSPEFLVTGITPVNPTCNGLSNGSATVNTSGGIAPYTYSWSTTPIQTAQTATGLSAGINYTVTVTDASMCVAIGNITLTEPAAIGLASVTANPVTGCFGGNNGSIQIAANGGTPNYTYTLFLGATQVGVPQTPVFPAGANFTGLLAGTYSVSITDVNACSEYTESNIIVSQPALLQFTYTTVDLSCYGDNSGEIHFSATGGTAPYQYSINNGITWVASPDFVGLSSANYSLRVKDNNGCITDRQLVKINQPSQLFSDGGTWQDVITCSGGNTGSITVIPGGGVPPYQFSINSGTTWQGSGFFPNLYAGTYTIIVEDASGCSINVGPITINEPDPINILSVDITPVTICSYSLNGEIFVWASGGTGDLEFSIDGGTTYQLDPLFENVGVGTYSIFVRDSKGCGKYAGDYVVTGPPAIVINPPTSTDATCFGASDGTITVTASGGTGVLEYSVNGTVYQATGNFAGLAASTYTIYVRDAELCVATATVVVGQPTPLYFTTQTATNITCNGLSDGQITLVAAGGSGSYLYSITGGAPYGNATGVFSGLPAGTAYVAAVQDASGCSTIGNTLTITEPALLTIDTESSSDIVCFGDNNGSIDVKAVGGTAPLTYTLLDAGLNILATNGTGTFTGLSAGVYTVDIDDANGCGPITAGPYTIAEPTQLTFTYTKVDLTCFGVPIGQIDIDATGGTFPYEYSIDGLPFDNIDVKTGLSGGNHTVVVRDANLCETTQVINLIEPAELVISLSPSNITCNGLTNGQIVATATGGDISIPYQFRIDGGAWQASGTFPGLSAGTYLIEVLDAAGCIDGESATITEPSAITVDLVNSIIVNPTCSALGSITAVGQGGTAPYTYTLNPGPGEVVNITGIFSDLAVGIYTVRIADANGCPVYDWSVTLVGPPALDYNIVNTPILCFGEKSTVTINVTSGTAPYEYSIDNEANYGVNNVFADVVAGVYQVWVKDVNNCKVMQTLTITEPADLILGAPVVKQETAPGASDGEIAITATGGTGALRYDLYLNGVLNTTQTVAPINFTGLAAGTYYIIVTDANGCFKQSPNVIISGMSIVVTQTNVLCNGGTDGKILVTITNGIPPFTVTCVSVPAGQSYPVVIVDPGNFQFENLPAGEYLISINDNAGTSIPNRQVTITEPTALVANYVSHTNPTCNGLVDGTVEFNITGGTPPYTITWTGGTSTGNIATGVGAGTFIFTITDANGCFVTVSDVPEITEPAGIQIIELTQFDPTCNGQAIGLINVTATGGFGALTYTLSGSANVTNQTGVFQNLLAGVYDLSITDANGCIGNFNPPVRITLTEPSPIVITGLVPTDPLVCPNDPQGFVRIQVDGGQPDYSFLWSNGQTSVDLENVVVGNYTVEVTDALNCKVSKTFTVAGPPKLVPTTLITQAQCRIKPTGDDGRIEITGTTGGNGSFTDLTFSWNDKFSTTGPIVGNISGGIYTVTITDLSSCVYTFDYEVSINPRFDYHAFAGKDSTVCFDNPVILHGKVNGGDSDLNYTYEWFEIPNTAGDPIFRGADFNIQLTESKSYLLRVTDDDLGCLDTTRVNLLVYPNIGLEVPMYISAVQDTIISVLMGKEFNMDVITQSVDFETTFEWKPAEMFLPYSSWNSSIIFNDEIKAQIPTDRFVTLQDPVTKRRTEYILVDVIATTEKGCVDSIRLYTKIIDDVAIGNVFSPNGDGINDRWSVPKTYLFPDLEVEIFNRWGSLVWSATGDKAAKGWDGRTNNGNELPIGTYYYILKYNVKAQGSNWKPETGSVTIVK